MEKIEFPQPAGCPVVFSATCSRSAYRLKIALFILFPIYWCKGTNKFTITQANSTGFFSVPPLSAEEIRFPIIIF